MAALPRITCDQLPAPQQEWDVTTLPNSNAIQFSSDCFTVCGTCKGPEPDPVKWQHWEDWCCEQIKPHTYILESISIMPSGLITCSGHVFELYDNPGDGGGGDGGTGCAFVDRTHI